MKSALIIFIKNPELGKVKTRIARTLGDEKALAVYLKLLDITRKAALATATDRHLFYGQYIDHQDDWQATHFTKHLQHTSSDLGERMYVAFGKILSAKYEKAIIVGSDIPEISEVILQQGFESLNTQASVIGRAKDGGYYAIGFNFDKIPDPDTLLKEIFLGKTWSHANVANDAIEVLGNHGIKPAQMPLLSDADTEADVLHLI